MTKEKYIKLSYYFTLLILFVLMSLLICGFLGLFNTDKAYADYQNDILNNSDAIVNFNQLYGNNVNTSGSYARIDYTLINNKVTYSGSQGLSYVPLTGYTYNQTLGDKFYIYATSSDDNLGFYTSGIGSQTFYKEFLYTANASGSPTLTPVVGGGYNVTVNGFGYINLINLTLMFGSGNEPTLEQCKNIFTANYYNYNIGVAMPFNTITAYNQGVNDTLSTLEYDRLNYGAISSAFIDSSFNNSNAFVRKYFEPTNTDYSYYLQARGYLFIPFASAVNSGNLISFKYYDPGQGGSGNYLWCGVYSSNNFYPVMFIGDLTGETVSFASPVSTQYLVFADSSTRDYFTFSDSAYWLGDFTVEGAKVDIKAVIDAAVRSRDAQLNEYYNSFYGEGGTGYQAIYDAGYQVGLHTDVDGFARQYYTFPQFIGALFDVPVQVILSLLDFNVLGFNMKTLVLSILTITIVFALVRFVLAKQKGD